jgi:dipeptidyl aminopeptidase/acylaminoacyl peptidase
MRALLLALGLTLAFVSAVAAGAITTTRSEMRNGPLMLFTGGTSSFDSSGLARIVTIGSGEQRTIWHCPGKVWCGEAVSFAWGPNGRRLAATFDEVGGSSPYPLGVHILDVVSGQDRTIFRDRVGCFPASQLSWSPDGSRLAYACGSFGSQVGADASHIYVLKLRGSARTAVWTGSPAFWPSWSPNGRRLAYSTQLQPTQPLGGIFTVGLHGADRRFVARGVAPAWSPDGKTIAYETNCGIRLATPSGMDVTPRTAANRCGALGFSGPPIWSPDGTKLAAETTHKHGIYVMDKGGGGLHWVSLGLRETRTWYRRLPGRPSWQSRH